MLTHVLFFIIFDDRNESGDKIYEDDGCTSDLDADKELIYRVGDEESHNKRRCKLTTHFAELML